MMKKLFYGLITVLFLIIAGCSSNNKTKLVVYSPHGKEMLSEFEKQFEAIHTDIDIQCLDMGSQ